MQIQSESPSLSREFRIVRGLTLVLVGLAAALFYDALGNTVGRARLALTAGLAIGLSGGWLIGRPAHVAGPSWLPGTLLTVCALILSAVLPELALRRSGFRFEGGIDFAPGPGAFARYVPDRTLLWRWDSRYGLNSLGFPAPEPAIPKPASMLRILYLGDSCSYAELDARADDSYPALTQSMLAPTVAKTGLTLDTVNLAMPGYSSHQGLALAERHGRRLAPDVVVVYFGWNDHWPAFDAIDAEKKIETAHGFMADTFDTAMKASRVVQATAWLGTRWRGGNRPIEALRVPRGQYEANLIKIAEHFEAMGATPVFLTAPTAHYRVGVPDALFTRANFGPDAATIIERHRAYNQVVRMLSMSRSWHLLDLERALEDHPSIATLFTDDGIHFTSSGKAYVAAQLTAYLSEYLRGRFNDRSAAEP